MNNNSILKRNNGKPSIDDIGKAQNVLGLRRGRGNGQMIAVAAHLDTVEPIAPCAVQAAFAALPHFGFEPSTESRSTDANIPMSLGIPAVSLGTGGDSGRAHSLEEWIDVEPEASLRGLYAGLATILETAGLTEDR